MYSQERLIIIKSQSAKQIKVYYDADYAHNNGKGIKKEKKKRENRNQLLKLRITILYKNKCVPWVILTI